MAEDTDGTGPFTPAIDAHVHLFPERLAEAIQRALTAEAGWEFPSPTDRGSMEATLAEAGVERYVALPYVHEPGGARSLNAWLAEQAADSGSVVPFATVHPDDEEVGDVVRDAFEAGARGLKFHCPVQQCAPADPRIEPALEAAVEYDRPITYHGGTAPMFEDSPYVGADRFAEVVESYPDSGSTAPTWGRTRSRRSSRWPANTTPSISIRRSQCRPRPSGRWGSTRRRSPTRRSSSSRIRSCTGATFRTSRTRTGPNAPSCSTVTFPENAYRDIFYRTATEFLDLDDE